MKNLSLPIVLILASVVAADETYVIQFVNNNTFLLNAHTGESHILDVDSRTWVSLGKTTAEASSLAGDLRVLCGDVSGQRMIPVPARKGNYS